MKTLPLTTWILAGSLALPAGADDDIMRRPPKPSPDGSELARLIRQTRVGEPYHYRNLTVFPLFSSEAASRGYWTLDRALAKGVLRITEKGDASVPELVAENRADEPVFLMAGEIVRGGKQNRVISQDILLPPRSGPISLDVFCVEQGRWEGHAKHFSAEKEAAHTALRRELNAPAVSQERVWSEVDRKSSAVGASAGRTRDLSQVLNDDAVRRDVDEYARRITLPRQANGMAVMIGGAVVGAELFGDAETFRSLQDKLLRSYAADAIERRSSEKFVGDRWPVERFLRRAEDARLVPKRTLGLGRLLGIEGSGLYGTALVWRGQAGAHGVVHASLFAE
jgi:hypothetical protein